MYKANVIKISTLISVALLSSACGQIQQESRAEKTTDLDSVINNDRIAKHNIELWPKLTLEVKKDPKIEATIVDMINKMTVEQKVAQMIQPEIRDITVEDMRKYGFGSYLNGGGAFPNDDKHATAGDWIKLAEKMYQASVDDSIDGSAIPTMWGTDAVHGHNNVIGATLFPHNIGLGAANNPQLIEQIAAITAKEVMVTGIDWVFAPTVAVVRDDRWGRSYEGYSEDPEIVRNYAASIVKGLQGAADQDFLGNERVISTVKHFLGDGGTEGGDDQGDNLSSEQALFDLHAQGYISGLAAGAQSVMASFNSWHGKKNHGNEYLLTDVLKTQMGFDGFVVGDWNGHGQIAGCTNESCPQSINAGLDIFMVPTAAWKPLFENTIAQIKTGEISQARIDDAVSRILRVKFRAGLFNKPSPAKRILSGKTELIGATQHRRVARQAVRESMVLLKNNHNILPLSPKQHILIAGDGADNIGKQSGGWTITWQGTGNNNDDFPGGTSIFKGIANQVNAAGGQTTLSIDGRFSEKPDVAIVVFGEEPYAEGHGDLDNLEYQRGNKKDLALLKRLKAQNIPVVAVFISGRPMWVNAELNASDAFVAAWLPGSEGHGIAEVLFVNEKGAIQYDFKGKLSFSWPATAIQTSINRFDHVYQPLLPYGFGLRYGDASTLINTLNEESELTTQTTDLVIFDRAEQKPWQLLLQSSTQREPVINSIQTLGALTIKTLDKNVQEDARTLVFDGTELASVSFMSNFPEDLRSYIETDSALTLTVKVDNPSKEIIKLSMLCESVDNAPCGSSLDVTRLFTGTSDEQWHQVSIDLACFKQAGTDFSKVITPFKLSTAGKLTVSFADISLQANKASAALMKCR
ncbi:MAG: beta-glucosidase [Alteromonadaceae bacterium]|jgi:beta-glucosidase